MVLLGLLLLAMPARAQTLEELAKRRFDVFDDTEAWKEHRRQISAFFVAPDPKRGGGLHIKGLDFLNGDEPVDSSAEPFLDPGIERLLDWDVRLQVRQDSLGFKADYRNPEALRRLSFSFAKTEDVPELAGVGHARDTVFSWLGKKDDGWVKEGWKAACSAVVDEWWGFSGAYSEAGKRRGEEFSYLRMESLGVGFSPLGLNGGKPWNWSLFASGNHQEKSEALSSTDHGPLTTVRRNGFGYSVGTAWQLALQEVDFPVIGKGDPKGFSFDRLRTELSCSDSEIGDFNVRAAVELSCRVTRHIRLFSGADCTYCPADRSWDLGNKLGVGFHF